jgi:hypothetical protein
VNWVAAAAVRLSIPLRQEFTTVRMHYPAPTRWAKCSACGSTVWNLARFGQDAADAFEVHAAFCRGRR